MATVWTYTIYAGLPKFQAGYGWTHCPRESIYSISDVVKYLQEENLQGQVTKLAMVSHGGPGGLLFPVKVELKNLNDFQKDFRALGDYLTADGELYFFGCNVGSGALGDFFLSRVSNWLAGRTIIGFYTTNKSYTAQGQKNFAGLMYPTVGEFTETQLDKWHVLAKWAKNGWIIRAPLPEVQGLQMSTIVKNPRRYCGSMLCLGHNGIGHQCKFGIYRRTPQFMDLFEDLQHKKSDTRIEEVYKEVYGLHNKVAQRYLWEEREVQFCGTKVPMLLSLCRGLAGPFALHGSLHRRRKKK